MMRKADWLIPIGLMLLGVVPFVAGVLRIVELGGDPVITTENARFFDDPVPVVIHIATSLTFTILGALQFSPGLRRSRPHWHRISGRLLVLPGFASALSGLWMTLFYLLLKTLRPLTCLLVNGCSGRAAVGRLVRMSGRFRISNLP